MPKSKSAGLGLARTVAMAVIIGIGLFNVYQAVANWTLSDASAYWNAALRLREGGALYPLVTNVEASEVYRYAPWFAWVTVPITWMPHQVAATLWSATLLAASGVALMPLVRAREWLLVALFGPILIGISATGNVHPLLVAALMVSVERRSGPVWIGVVASLKIFPILFAAVYVGRREWSRAALAIAVAVALWAPALLYDLRGYVTDAGQAVSLVAVPALWVLVMGAGVVLTLRLANTRFAWLAAATTVVLSLPRLFVYDDTYLMVGAVTRERRPKKG
jgi:Glycosyltransferase family 87